MYQLHHVIMLPMGWNDDCWQRDRGGGDRNVMIQEGFYLLVVAQNPNWEMDIRARMQILLWPTTQLAVSPSSRILQSTAQSLWL